MSNWKLHTPSPEKIAANQANAQLSSGPKTPEGKARSASNSLKHGLTARELVIRPEDKPAFDELHAGYLAELQPQGVLETELFNAIVHAAWNLRRVRMLEAGTFDGVTDPLLDEQNEARLDRLSRYYRRFENTLHRSLRELRSLQAARAARSKVETIAALAGVRDVQRAKRTQSTASTAALNDLLRDLERQDRGTLADLRAGRGQNEAARGSAA